MATYVGYRRIPHSTYDAWRSATIHNMYDVDGYYSGQCWDFCSLLWWQYGYTLITKAGGGLACDCWNYSRLVNSQPPFISLTGKENIKRGDVLVWNQSSYYPGSHIAFADEDYNGTNYINAFGQNQYGSGGGSPAEVRNLSLNSFLGIFRNTMWMGDTPTPTPEGEYNKNRYNFVLFNRRKRQEKWTKKPLKRR